MYRTRAILLSGTALLASAGTAHADTGTTAGTTISNTASVSYTVNGNAQTTNSTTSSFVVDRKANFTVTLDQSGFTQATVNQQNVFVKFKVTNTTNGTQDFILDPDQQNISLGILPGTDNFDLTGLKAYVDKNGNGVYDPGVDTAEYIDELAPDASATVFLVGNVPNSQSINLAFTSMHVTIATGGTANSLGAALVATDLNLANADNTVDIVFADDDSDGAYAGDIARNGQGRAYGGVQVTASNVALSVTKTAKVISDGVNALLPKALPGAEVEYCFVVNNGTANTAASAVVLTDLIPANTTYVPGSISLGPVGILGACLLTGSTEDDDDSDSGEIDGYTASFNPTSKTVTMNIASVPGNTSVGALFHVKIN
ncbi:hypothetical protein [Novosphingobium sp. JCM 18896]|uniref:hypothetical protein n=1 Tax=Novosphingobium sp. JCM 18896 TaxID=2989731 RepID=UPI002223D43E|nr:hypothetical protein [Novosphingobium sp. JCM 18896]MCW1430754.1 hypothetical protein [Novosphingobium sp. JCM 18896]